MTDSLSERTFGQRTSSNYFILVWLTVFIFLISLNLFFWCSFINCYFHLQVNFFYFFFLIVVCDNHELCYLILSIFPILSYQVMCVRVCVCFCLVLFQIIIEIFISWVLYWYWYSFILICKYFLPLNDNVTAALWDMLNYIMLYYYILLYSYVILY